MSKNNEDQLLDLYDKLASQWAAKIEANKSKAT